MNQTSKAIARALAGLTLSGAMLAGSQVQARTTQNCGGGCGSCTVWLTNCSVCYPVGPCSWYGENCTNWGCDCSLPEDHCEYS